MNGDTFEALMKCQEEILRIDLVKLERMSEKEKEVRDARKKIEGELLVLSCPGCQKSFTEWSACGVVQCCDDRGFGCKTTFCCYCQEKLTDHGDPHRHVLDCPLGGPKPQGVRLQVVPTKVVFGSSLGN